MLPPLHELFEDSCGAISSRPIHMGCDIDWPKLEVNCNILCHAIANSFHAIHPAMLLNMLTRMWLCYQCNSVGSTLLVLSTGICADDKTSRAWHSS